MWYFLTNHFNKDIMCASKDISIEEARKAMIAKRFGGNVKGAATGGEGSVRRKKVGSIKNVADDKKLGGVLKKMGLTPINAVEEVNIFRDNGDVIHIATPKSKTNMIEIEKSTVG